MTTGTVVAVNTLNAYQTSNMAGTPAWVLVVRGNPSNETTTTTYPLDMARYQADNFQSAQQVFDEDFKPFDIGAELGGTATEPTITITNHPFSRQGDSGAAVVDDQENLVGLIHGGTARRLFVAGEPEPIEVRTNRSFVVFIKPVFTRLGVSLPPETHSTFGSRRIVVPGAPIERQSRPPWLALERKPCPDGPIPRKGARLLAVCQTHAPEVRDLVHHRRRVTVTWHRNRGPAFVAAAMRASNGHTMAAEVGEVRLVGLLRAMRDVLLAEGSPALAAAIRANEAEVFAFTSQATTLSQLMALLSTEGAA